MPGAHVREVAPRERVEPTVRGACGEHDDAEQRDAEAERGEDEVLPRRLERSRLPPEAHEQRGRGGGRLDEEPRAAEIPDERDRTEDRPEAEDERIEQAWPPFRTHETRGRGGEVGGRHENGGETDDADYADEQPGSRVDDDPALDERAAGRRERDDRQRGGGGR